MITAEIKKTFIDTNLLTTLKYSPKDHCNNRIYYKRNVQ